MSEKILQLLLPDWGQVDTVLASPKPFALWQIGDQPLIYHWLDHAVNQRLLTLQIFVADRPDAIRKAMSEATLWPIEWEVIPIKNASDPRVRSALPVTGLPWWNPSGIAPSDGWKLLDHWFALERSWLDTAITKAPEGAANGIDLAIGRGASVHPSATLKFPVYIGDGAIIGEECEIGPYASIGAGSMIAGGNLVAYSKVAPRTILGMHTALDHCYLQGGLLANLRHRGLVPKIEAFLADGWETSERTSEKSAKPPISERAEALYAWAKLEFLKATGGISELAAARLPKIRDAVLGRGRLYGVLPRSSQDLEALDPEWTKILSSAQVGAISLADAHGCHTVRDAMEPLHAVYQSTHPAEEVIPACRSFLKELIKQADKSRSKSPSDSASLHSVQVGSITPVDDLTASGSPS